MIDRSTVASDSTWIGLQKGYRHIIQQGGTSCFDPHQLIITTKGSIPISEIKKGDRVLSCNILSGKKEYRDVINTFKHPNTKPCLEISLKSGHKIKATEDHKFFFSGRWVMLKNIAILWYEKNTKLQRLYGVRGRPYLLYGLQKDWTDEKTEASVGRGWISEDYDKKGRREICNGESSSSNIVGVCGQNGGWNDRESHRWEQEEQLNPELGILHRIRESDTCLQKRINKTEERNQEWYGQANNRRGDRNKKSHQELQEQVLRSQEASGQVRGYRSSNKRYIDGSNVESCDCISLDDIVSIDKISLDFVYDIEVEKNHNFFLDLNKPTLVHNSGKTFGILVALIHFAASSEKSLIISVAGQTVPHLKQGAMRDLQAILDSEQIPYLENKTDRIFSIGNSIIEFIAIDKLGKAKGAKRDILFVNEANEIDYSIFKQLSLRTGKTIIIDFNPTHHFWLHDNVVPHLKKGEYIFKRTNYTHNPGVSSEIAKEIESLKELDEELYKVYGLGYTGKIQGIIFSNVKWVDAMPDYLNNEGYGLDFGFTNDPTAFCRAGIYQGEIYAEELIYERGLTNADLCNMFTHLGVHSGFKIVADREPKSIEEINQKGFWCEAAEKGPGSVNFGISTLKSYKINIVKSSVNWKREQSRYKWQEKDGKPTNKPVDAYNHLWDALRYWADGCLNSHTPIMTGYSY